MTFFFFFFLLLPSCLHFAGGALTGFWSSIITPTAPVPTGADPTK
jgi:hypothetical protein